MLHLIKWLGDRPECSTYIISYYESLINIVADSVVEEWSLAALHSPGAHLALKAATLPTRILAPPPPQPRSPLTSLNEK